MRCFTFLSRKLRAILWIPLVFALFATSGCGTSLKEFYFDDLFGKGSSTVDKTAEQLALDGMANLQKKDFEEAVKDFKKLKEHYPYSKYAILAELKLGDAYFFDKKYAEAALAYEEFVRLHPRNEVVPYVLYQVGLSHFLMYTTTDRDPEETQTAMQSFQRVIQMFPDSDYAKKSQKQLNECRKRLLAHEFSVAEFYYRIGEYQAAKNRISNMVQKYPQAINELGYGKEVEKMMAKCEFECAKGEKGPGVWTKLGF